MKTYYKHVMHNEKFTFRGQEYIKTNHQRGYFMEAGRKQFRTFQPSSVVETTENPDLLNAWRQAK